MKDLNWHTLADLIADTPEGQACDALMHLARLWKALDAVSAEEAVVKLSGALGDQAEHERVYSAEDIRFNLLSDRLEECREIIGEDAGRLRARVEAQGGLDA